MRWWHYICYITHYHHLIIYEHLYLAIGRISMMPLLSDGFQNGELFPFFTLSRRTRNVLQLHGVRVPDGFVDPWSQGWLHHVAWDDSSARRFPEAGWPSRALSSNARHQESCHARDLPHNLLKSKAGKCGSRVLVNSSTLTSNLVNSSFGYELICQSIWWFDVIWLHQVLCSDCVCEPAYGESWEELVEVIEKILAPDGSVLISLRHGRHKGMGCLWLWMSILENLILNTAFHITSGNVFTNLL